MLISRPQLSLGQLELARVEKCHCEEIIPMTVKSSTVTGLELRHEGNDQSIIRQFCQLFNIFVNYR